jgi:hypothetical protein
MSVHPIPYINDDVGRAGKVRNRSNVKGIREYVAVLIEGTIFDGVLMMTPIDLYVIGSRIGTKDKVGKRFPTVSGVVIDKVGGYVRHCVSYL